MIGLDVGRLGEAATVLCIGAHCDDIEIGCGGTLSKWAAHHPGMRFVWAVFAGERGRADETRRAVARMSPRPGAFELRLFDFPASYFPAHYAAIKERFEALKGAVEPDLVLTHTREDRHQDHALLADLTWNTFRSHLVLEYEIPKYEGDLGRPNAFVHLTEPQVDAKVAMLMDCFASQHSRAWFTPETFKGLARIRGIESAAPGGYAEAFHVRKFTL